MNITKKIEVSPDCRERFLRLRNEGGQILNEYGIQVPVIVLSAEELNEAISDNPFSGKKSIEIERLHLTFLKEIPEDEKS